MDVYLILSFLIWTQLGVTSCQEEYEEEVCNQRRLRRCAADLARFKLPMIETHHNHDFTRPARVVRRFCRRINTPLNCVYNQLPGCQGEVDTRHLEEKAGIISYVCGQGRRDYINGYDCWQEHNVAHRIRHCKTEYNIDDLYSIANAGNFSDNTDMCRTIDDFVWRCVGQWASERCSEAVSQFLIRIVNPEELIDKLHC